MSLYSGMRGFFWDEGVPKAEVAAGLFWKKDMMSDRGFETGQVLIETGQRPRIRHNRGFVWPSRLVLASST
jgi:hypothetical protein